MKSLPLLIITLLAIEQSRSEETLTVEISTITEGTTEWDMTQARSAHVPGKNPLSITTMSKTARVGAHGFHDVFLSTSRDLGKTWSEPTVNSLLEAFPENRRIRSRSRRSLAAMASRERENPDHRENFSVRRRHPGEQSARTNRMGEPRS